jgi:hypothetical protein
VTQSVHGSYVFDDETMRARRATFDDLRAPERAQHLGASIFFGVPMDGHRLRSRCDSVLAEANIKPLWRVRIPKRIRDLPREELVELAGQALIDFSCDLTKRRARTAELYVYALARVTPFMTAEVQTNAKLIEMDETNE